MLEKEATQVSIFNYTDYRAYLADFYEAKKASNPRFSHRMFASQAGLSSPSHLLMIINGSRNLSMKTIPKFASGLKLSAKEKKHFEHLVLYNQSDDIQTKAQHLSDLMTLKASVKGLHSLDKEKFDFLSKWHVVAIYVLTDLVGFRPDPAWIVKKLDSSITEGQAKDALENLVTLGMIEEKKGSFRQIPGALTIADDTRSVAVFCYHRSMIHLASEALRKQAPENREMNGATIAIPKDKLPELKERIRQFRKEMNQLASSYENPDELFQLNIQLFPLTALEKK